MVYKKIQNQIAEENSYSKYKEYSISTIEYLKIKMNIYWDVDDFNFWVINTNVLSQIELNSYETIETIF